MSNSISTSLRIVRRQQITHFNFKIMNKSMKPKAPIPPKPKKSEEERKEQMTRAFLQKRASLAEGILFNLCQGVNIIPRDEEINLLVDRSVEMADRLMEKLYGAKKEE